MRANKNGFYDPDPAKVGAEMQKNIETVGASSPWGYFVPGKPGMGDFLRPDGIIFNPPPSKVIPKLYPEGFNPNAPYDRDWDGDGWLNPGIRMHMSACTRG